MPTAQDVYYFLDRIAPFSTQESWDTCGLQVGDPLRTLRRVGVTLDCTQEVIIQAAEQELDLLVSHHPVVFGAQTQFLASSPAYRLASAGIAAISAHTNLDCAKGGVNDVLCETLGLRDVQPLQIPDCNTPLLRSGLLEQPLSPAGFAALTAKKLGASVRFHAGGKAQILTVAVCGGAGGDFCKAVGEQGIDAFVTGDANHHDFLDAQSAGLCLAAAGHFESEWPIVPRLAELLREAFPDLHIAVMRQEVPCVLF